MKMKDKKAAQKEAKEKHLVERNAAKAKRRGEPVLERSPRVREERPTILIVCEGKNTEPSYFNQFKLTTATVRALGNGNNTVSLVNLAITLKEKGTYEEVWCVFDKDDFSADDFNSAIQTATVNNLKVAYSNQSFEYWLILHFEDHQGGAMHRDEYDKTLNEYLAPLGAIYEGNSNKIVSEDLFDLLMATDEKLEKSRIELAITRAERNYNLLSHISPATKESSTTVFKLASRLRSFI